MRTTYLVGNGPGSKATGLRTHQKLENCEPSGLTQGRKRCERVRRGHAVATRGWADVTDNR
ncbi:MAG: hypothetical protein WBY84_11315 [Pseudolabrys sp.]